MLLYFISIFLLIITIGACVVVAWIVTIFFATKVPYVRTPRGKINLLLSRFHFSSRDVVIDLGCGSAETLIAIEKQSGAATIGYELSPFAFVLAKLNIWRQHAKTKVYMRDFFKADISKATIVSMFLLQRIMGDVERFLDRQCKPGTVIISYAFTLPTWKPEKVIKGDSGSVFFVYRKH